VRSTMRDIERRVFFEGFDHHGERLTSDSDIG
jgi:hypothetical protein